MPVGSKLQSYDAISIINEELFVFKDQYVWRISENKFANRYPLKTELVWEELPKNYKRIDAVYANQSGKVVFFIDKMFYSFSKSCLIYSGSQKEFGLPDSIKIDAIFIERRTLIFLVNQSFGSKFFIY